jgi:fructokinase
VLEALAPLGAPIALDTDVNACCACRMDLRRRARLPHRRLCHCRDGIGAGVLRDGGSLIGFGQYEMGHIRPRRDPDDTFAGRVPVHGDCLEGMAAGPAVQQRWGHDLSSASPAQVALIAGYAAQLAAILVLAHMPAARCSAAA